MRKSVPFGTKPTSRNQPANADAWVEAGVSRATAPDSEVPAPAPIPMKRLTVDIPESLHRAIKTQCSSRGLRMADEIRDLLEKHFRSE